MQDKIKDKIIELEAAAAQEHVRLQALEQQSQQVAEEMNTLRLNHIQREAQKQVLMSFLETEEEITT